MADEIIYDSTQPVRSQQSANYTPTGLSDQNNLNAYNANRENQIQNVYDTARQNTLAGMKTAYDQNLSDLQAARDKITPQYQQSANALAAEYERQKRNTNMQGAASGLNTGAGSQLALGQSMAYQRNAGNLARSQNEALNEANRGITDLGVRYRNEIAQAVASNNYELAKAKLNEYENQYNRQMTLENQNWERARQLENQAYQRAYNEENRDYSRAYDIENRDYNRNWNTENRDYERAWNTENRDYTRDWNQNERDYNRAWNEEARGYDRYWDENDRGYNRAYQEENRDYQRAWDTENRDYNRAWNTDERDYTRAYNEENRDYTRAFNEDERDYTRAWNEDERGYDRTMTEAANRAEYGDFSGYAAIYGQGIADSMREVWIAQNPMVAYSTGAITADEYMMLTGKYPYNYGGSSGSSYGGGYRGGGGGYGGGSGSGTTATPAATENYLNYANQYSGVTPNDIDVGAIRNSAAYNTARDRTYENPTTSANMLANANALMNAIAAANASRQAAVNYPGQGNTTIANIDNGARANAAWANR